MNARVYIDGAVVSQEPVIVIGQKPHMLARVMLSDGNGEHEGVSLHIKIVGDLVDLEPLKLRMVAGAEVRLRGRLVGKNSYFLACWARHVRTKGRSA